MELKEQLSYYIQAGDGHALSEGIISTELTATALDSAQGLMMLDFDQSSGFPDAALKGAEIIMDDMAVNFDAKARTSAIHIARERAELSLTESFQNIHEYLQSTSVSTGQPPAALSLIALQFFAGQVCVCAQGEYEAMVFDGEHLKPLLDPYVTGYLGAASRKKPQFVHYELSLADMLLVMQKPDLKRVELRFLEMTVSRFSDNLEVAVRQINTRAKYQGIEYKPPLILARVDQPYKAVKKGWFN